MKLVLTVLLALLVLSVESVLVHYFDWSITRLDGTVVLLVFLGLRAGRVEGGLAAFCIGYLLDVMSGRPTGLYVFLAVLVYLLVRLAAMLVDVRGAPSFLLMVASASAGHSLLALLFTWMTSKSGMAAGSVGALFAQVFLSMGLGLLLWPLLRRIDSGSDRPEPGTLL